MLRKYYDKIIFTIALLFLIGCTVVFFQTGEELVAELDTDLPPVENVESYEMTPHEEIELDLATWGEARSQSAGDAWVYDIFTPPRIFYHEVEDRFDVQPPGPVDPDEVEIEIEFVGFEEEPYRIQLTGYIGSEENPRINLDDLESGQMIMTRKDRELPEFDIEIRGFSVRREQMDGVVSRVAEAVVFDRRTGEEVVLLEEEVKYLDEPAIVVRTTEDPPRTINARPGEGFDVGEHLYRVEEYTVDPPEIVVTKSSPDRDGPRRRTLTPGERL